MINLYNTLPRVLQALVGRTEYALRRSFGLIPMKGQAARLEIVREIFEFCKIERIIETGTFRGATTAWLAGFGKPVTTFEVSPVYAGYSRARLSAFANVNVRNVNSVDGLKALVREPINLKSPCFIYLDAHWYDYLPLNDELELIFGNFERAVVLIDDFQVPDDDGYYFDDYGSGAALTLDYLARSKFPLARFFLPAVKGQWETGARRGCIIVVNHPDIAEQLQNAPLLREWHVATDKFSSKIASQP